MNLRASPLARVSARLEPGLGLTRRPNALQPAPPDQGKNYITQAGSNASKQSATSSSPGIAQSSCRSQPGPRATAIAVKALITRLPSHRCLHLVGIHACRCVLFVIPKGYLRLPPPLPFPLPLPLHVPLLLPLQLQLRLPLRFGLEVGFSPPSTIKEESGPWAVITQASNPSPHEPAKHA